MRFSFRFEMNRVSMTESIFFRVEEMLSRNERLEDMVDKMARSCPRKYHSAIDFLLCETHPEWRKPCRLFYENEGIPLDKAITRKEKNKIERRILEILKMILRP